MPKKAPIPTTRARAKPGRPPKYDPAKVADAVKRSGGLVTVAARMLKADWHTVKRYVAEYPEVQAAYDEANEINLDDAEAGLIASVRQGDKDDRRFYLRTKGRARGYGDRTEHTGADGADLIPKTIEIVNKKPE
jgi:hypothetical protein